MKIDAKLYRQAYEYYRQWNEAKLVDRARQAASRDPEEAWRQYQALWRFFCQMGLSQSERQRQQKVAALEHYYDQVEKLEARRQPNGKRP